MSCPKVAGVLFACFSVSFTLISLATNFWMVNNDSQLHLGLWHGCKLENCFDVEGSASMNVSRAFMILAAIAGFISVFAGGASFSSDSSVKRTGSAGALLASCLAVLFLIIAVAVYTEKTKELLSHERSMFMYGWSFYLGWVAFPFLCITALLQYLAYRSPPTIGYEQV